MDFDQLYPGRFMKAGEFKGKALTLVVKDVKHEELGDGKEAETKVVMSFSNAKKALVLNKTNGTCFMAMFGRESDNWRGKRVTLYPAKIRDPFTGEDTLAIRVLGSPDIPQTTQYQATLGRKRVKFTLQKTTVANGKTQAAPLPPPEEPEAPDPFTGEVPIDAGPDSFGGTDFPEAP